MAHIKRMENQGSVSTITCATIPTVPEEVVNG